MPPTDHSIDNSAVVLAGPHYDDPYLPQPLATALAGYYDLHRRDFKVLRLERNIGDLLVEFPDCDLCRRAVLEGYFYLGKWYGDATQKMDTSHGNGAGLYAIPGTGQATRRALTQQEQARHQQLNCRCWLCGCHGTGHQGRHIQGFAGVDSVPSPKKYPARPPTDNLHSTLVRVELEGFINISNEMRTPLPPKDFLPPPALWRAQDHLGDGYDTQPVYRHDTDHRRTRREDHATADYRGHGDYGRQWPVETTLEATVEPNGGDLLFKKLPSNRISNKKEGNRGYSRAYC